LVLRRSIKITISLILLFIFIWASSSLVFNIKNVDRDSDNLSDKEEFLIGSDPLDKDTDKDGLNDFDEYNYWMNRSKKELSQNFLDFWIEHYNESYNRILTEEKIRKLLLPEGDIDNDNLSNICDFDSDNDNISDYKEILNKTDPALPNLDSSSNTDTNNSENDGGGSGSDEKKMYSTETHITILSSTEINKEGTFYVKGKVITTNQSKVTNSTIEIFINKTKNENGSFAGSGKVDSNGIFNITCEIPENVQVGSNHIVAHALGNDTYGDSWSDPIVNIYSDTKIALDILDSVGLNHSFQIKGRLTDTGNLALKEKIIEVKLEEIKISDFLTDENGEFKLNLTVHNLGEYDIIANFEGTEYLNSSTAKKTIIVKDLGTNIDVSLSKKVLKREEEIKIQGNLTDSNNQPIENANISIYYNKTKITTIDTNTDGFFEKDIIIPKNSSLGKNIIKATYKGNEEYGEAEKINQITVESETILEINPPEIKSNENNVTLTISGILTDTYDHPLPNKTVNIHSDLNKSYTKTSLNGTFEFNIKLPKNTSYGNYKIISFFSGSEYYLPTQKSITFKFSKNEEYPYNNILILIIPLILLGIGGVILTLLKRQKTQTNNTSIQKIATQSINNLQNEKDPRKAVLQCYSDMCKWLDASGLKKQSDETPREFAIEIKERLDVTDECLINLTKIFEKACYSKHEIDVYDRDKTIQCLDEILSSLVNTPHDLNKEE